MARAVRLTRRAILKAAGFGLVCAPALSRAADRPVATHGVQSGDISQDGGVIWSRTDRPAIVQVEWSTIESFRRIGGIFRTIAEPGADFTAKVLARGLPADQHIFYRATFLNLAEINVASAPIVGRFRTAPAGRRDIRFVWSADTAGQGWGIDVERGGMACYETMRRNDPDFFIHCGDTIYADGPILPTQKTPDGSLWKNLVIEEKLKAAETLAEFRASYKYNLLDRNVLAFNAQTPGYYLWDDHEVTDNWWPEQPLDRPDHRARKYTEKNVKALTMRAARAFNEFLPLRAAIVDPPTIYRKMSYGPSLDLFFLDLRSYRGPNSDNRQADYGSHAHCLGPTQTQWLKRELKASRATWKVIAASQPIALYVADDWRAQSGSEAIAQNDHGPPLGRELEIADILAFMRREKIRNTVWLTGDVHYTAAHHYTSERAAFQDFEPFWEFVSGPLHAGTFGPNLLDRTFGPQVRFFKAPTAEQGVNLPPSSGLQFFGCVDIDGATETMKVTLKDCRDASLWSVVLEPQRRQ